MSVRVDWTGPPSSDVNRSNSGIPTKAGIQAKWNRDLQDKTVRKVQVEKADEVGLPSGSMTWCIYVPVKWEAKDVRYKDCTVLYTVMT